MNLNNISKYSQQCGRRSVSSLNLNISVSFRLIDIKLSKKLSLKLINNSLTESFFRS